jgi:hypothetical protein
MKLVKVIFEVRLQKLPESFLYRNKIMRAITGKEQVEQVLNETIEFRDKEKGLHVFVSPNRFGLAIEAAEVKNWDLVVFDIYKKITNELNQRSLSRFGIRFLSYEEVNFKNFEDFVKQFNKTFLSQSSEVVGNSVDSAISIRFNKDSLDANLNAGPMRGKELIERVLDYPIKGLPKMYLHTDVDTFAFNLNFSNKALRDQLIKSKNYADDINNDFIADWKNNV